MPEINFNTSTQAVPIKRTSRAHVPPEKRIGSIKNYIKLPKALGKRIGLVRWLPENNQNADFSRHKKNDGFDHYVINLISTPELSPDALRLGLFLFQYFLNKNPFEKNGTEMNYIGDVFSLTEKSIISSKFGEDQRVYVGRPESKTAECYTMPFKSLSYILSMDNVRMTSFDLMPFLEELHNYAFIHILPISKANIIDQDIPDFETDCIRIVINTGASSAKINRKWLAEPNKLQGKNSNSDNENLNPA